MSIAGTPQSCPEPGQRTHTGRRADVVLGILCAAAAIVRVRAALVGPLYAPAYGDSVVYMKLVSQPWTTDSVLSVGRAPLVPLVYGLLGGSDLGIRLVQAGVAALAWTTLVWTAARRLDGLLKPILLGAAILGTSLELQNLAWERVAMSESLSISALVLCLTAAIWMTEAPTRAACAAFATACVAALACRDANVFVVFPAAVLLISCGLRRSRRLVWTGAVLVAGCAAAWSASSRGDRWVFPFMNVLTMRVLPDPGVRETFVRRGMPLTPELMERSGKWASDDGQRLLSHPSLETVRTWARQRGRGTLLAVLAADLPGTLSAPFENAKQSLGLRPFRNGAYLPPDFRSVLPDRAEELLRPETARSFLLFAGVAALAAVFAVRAGRRSPLLIVGAIGAALAVPALLASWHADAMEIERHAYPFGEQLRLSVWLLLAGALAEPATTHTSHDRTCPGR